MIKSYILILLLLLSSKAFANLNYGTYKIKSLENGNHLQAKYSWSKEDHGILNSIPGVSSQTLFTLIPISETHYCMYSWYKRLYVSAQPNGTFEYRNECLLWETFEITQEAGTLHPSLQIKSHFNKYLGFDENGRVASVIYPSSWEIEKPFKTSYNFSHVNFTRIYKLQNFWNEIGLTEGSEPVGDNNVGGPTESSVDEDTGAISFGEVTGNEEGIGDPGGSGDGGSGGSGDGGSGDGGSGGSGDGGSGDGGSGGSGDGGSGGSGGYGDGGSGDGSGLSPNDVSNAGFGHKTSGEQVVSRNGNIVSVNDLYNLDAAAGNIPGPSHVTEGTRGTNYTSVPALQGGTPTGSAVSSFIGRAKEQIEGLPISQEQKNLRQMMLDLAEMFNGLSSSLANEDETLSRDLKMMGLAIGIETLDVASDFTPYLGSIKEAVKLGTGIDPFALPGQEQLSDLDKSFIVFSMAIPPGFKGISKKFGNFLGHIGASKVVDSAAAVIRAAYDILIEKSRKLLRRLLPIGQITLPIRAKKEFTQNTADNMSRTMKGNPKKGLEAIEKYNISNPKRMLSFSQMKMPNKRHFGARVKMSSTAKNQNTVIEPNINVQKDIEDLLAGNGKREGQNFIVNDRKYQLEDSGALVPVSGPGLHAMSRMEYKALGVLNDHGNTSQASSILDSLTDLTPEERQRAYDIWELMN